ncbi:hypothetical protein [Larkinella knui]|uniref:Uncharacterized protein n=1 Tax=Larkinella knui TaxID=2025310 RepID=A0A3P1CY93_9BACT|nr:hypothetical protein [Larkinella knui]RRB18128.1 hypothetical protein EHT87_07595 [Larkinella knui]
MRDAQPENRPMQFEASRLDAILNALLLKRLHEEGFMFPQMRKRTTGNNPVSGPRAEVFFAFIFPKSTKKWPGLSTGRAEQIWL